MKGGKVAAQFVLLAVVAFAIWWSFFPSPERAIKKRLDKLGELVSANVSGSNIKRVANVNRIVDYFSNDVMIRADAFSEQTEVVTGRDSVMQGLLAARASIPKIEAKFYNVAIMVDESRTNATVGMTALVKLNDQPDPLIRDVKMQMRKEGRAWLITSVEPVGAAPPP